jgi:HlyD family secretion protein
VTQNVVTYTVVANAPNKDLLLLPGMTATAKIIVSDEEKLAAPNMALRFHPPGQARGPESTVYVQRGGSLVAVPVRIGATDGTFTAIASDDLSPGEAVITGLLGTSAEKNQKEQRVLGIF